MVLAAVGWVESARPTSGLRVKESERRGSTLSQLRPKKAKKFLSFQLAKLLDTLQNPFRRSYQALGLQLDHAVGQGPVRGVRQRDGDLLGHAGHRPHGDVHLRLRRVDRRRLPGQGAAAGDLFAAAESHVDLAGEYIVDIEAGPYAGEYFAWNFNSGMAAIDGVLSHVLGPRRHADHQPQHLRRRASTDSRLVRQAGATWRSRVETFDGYGGRRFRRRAGSESKQQYADRLAAGRQAYVYLESPCNPHGYVLDVPAHLPRGARARAARDARRHGRHAVSLRPLQRDDPAERPDFVIHSYTKDLSGTGSVIAGVVIGRNEDMFIPKGETCRRRRLERDDVLERVLRERGVPQRRRGVRGDAGHADARRADAGQVHQHAKSWRGSSPRIRRSACTATRWPTNANSPLREKLMFLGLPAPLFTIDMRRRAARGVPAVLRHPRADVRPHDQPGPVEHDRELPGADHAFGAFGRALREAGITPTTIRFAVGDEFPGDLIAHIVSAARLFIDPEVPGFSSRFPTQQEVTQSIENCYVKAHRTAIRELLAK